MKLLYNKKIWWFIISGLIIVPGILSLIFWRLNFGIDFKGGALLEVKTQKEKVKTEEALDTIKPLNLPDLNIITTNQNTFLIKTAPIDQEKVNEIKSKLKEKFGEIEEVRYENVGPVVGSDLKNKTIWAVSLACLLIILYVAWAFKNIKSGVSAIIALVHDLFVVTGIFSIVSHFTHWEIDSYFIVGLLTILGFSVHDTIVVFDRIRENLKRHPGYNFEDIANESLIQTLGRSLNTSLTVLIALFAMFLLGGESLKPFIFTLLVGIFIGTYSSIFIATPILVLWQGRGK